MASASAGQNSLTVYWASFGTTGNIALNYNVELYRGSTLVNSAYGLSPSARSYSFSGLSSGTYYSIKVYANMQVGANKVEWAYITTESPQVSLPNPPSVLYYSTSRGLVSFNWPSVYNADYYCLEVYDSSGYIIRSNYSIYATNGSFNVPNGQTYSAKVYSRNIAGSSSYGTWAYNITLPDYRPSTPSGFTNTGRGSGYLSFSWYSSTNASSYCLEVYQSATDRLAYSNYNIYGTSINVTGLYSGVNYYAKLYAQNSDGNSSPTYLYNLTAGNPIPTTPTGFSANASNSVKGQINASWYSVSYADRYYVTARENNYNGYQAYAGYTTSTSIQFSLKEYQTYYVTVSAVNDTGASNYVGVYVNTPDLTAPVITSFSGDGNGKMFISYNATDSMSGMRSTSRYYTQISNNGTSYGQGAYTMETYRTFIADANGNEFVHNTYYTMQVIAYDQAGNTAAQSARIQYKVARPPSWNWMVAKVAGQPVNLTAAEWNSFCTRLNQFRQYKGHENYNFTKVNSGGLITAAIINQAIYALSNIASAPALVSAGSPITATLFNTLTTNMNNIS